MPDFTTSVWLAVTSALNQTAAFLPNLLWALVIFIVGVSVAVVLKNALIRFLEVVNFSRLLTRTGFPQTLRRVDPTISVERLLGDLLKWFVIIVFLLPAVEKLGLVEFSRLLNQLLLYLPNVIVAVIIVMVGAVFAQFARDFVLAAAAGLGASTDRFLSQLANWSIMVFSILAALNQLQIAQNLIQTLFMGFVAMLAIAGGLAFGLGGRDVASDILRKIREDISEHGGKAERPTRRR